MADHRRMYVGTEDGVLVFVADDGRWVQQRAAFEGKSIGALVASPGGGGVFAAIPHDGIFLSTDGGRSWDRSFAGDVRSLAVDPSHPATVYAGTEPIHLFRSTDAGDHWVEVEGLQRMPEEVREKWWFPIYPHEGHVLSISVDHRDPRVIYLGLEHGGIVRTDDGGDRWEDLSAGIEYLDIHMVEPDPVRDGLVYAATARAFYRSEDRGHDWVLSQTGLTRDYMHDFVLRPGPRSSLFLTTANGTPPAWARASRAEAAIFRSDDGGLTWGQLGGGLPGSMGRMAWALVGDPAKDSLLYAGMGDYTPNLMDRAETAGGEIWTSADRGDVWSRIAETPSPVRSLCVA